MNVKKMQMRYLLSTVILCLLSTSVIAETKIAILDFELKDLTLAPRIPAEIKRTASIKPLHDVAANLGKQFGADYVLVGRLHKPSVTSPTFL